MTRKTNILLVSLVAMMSVGVAHSENATKDYVDTQDTGLYNRIRTQDERIGLIRDWVNPKVNGVRATLKTDEQDAYRAINELHTALAGKANAADIPDVSDMETKTHAAEIYQPKGDYLTEHQSLEGYATTEALAGKQDAISDLETIRSGAAAGATAVQPSALEGYATTSDLSGYATTEALNGKQPALTESQLAAVNSGVTSTTVAQVDANKDAIAIQDAALTTINETLATKADAELTAQALNSKADASAVETALADKQDTISDLATIRSGAAAGATAVQPSALESALATKQATIDAEHPLSYELVDGLATVAHTGDYGDLQNAPTQVQADWAQTDSNEVDFIKNKPTLAAVATSGSYNSLSDRPDLTQYATTAALADKANAADVYTKSETYTQTEVNQAITQASLSGNVTVDSTLDANSLNPVQNKVVTGALGAKVPLGNVPQSGQYVLGFVEGVQTYIPIVEADGTSGEAYAAVSE